VLWWSVRVEAHGNDLTALTDKTIFRFASLLEPHHGIATAGQARATYGATISVEAGTAAVPSPKAKRSSSSSRPVPACLRGRLSAPGRFARTSLIKNWDTLALNDIREPRVVAFRP
jgi:hypothetical protein